MSHTVTAGLATQRIKVEGVITNRDELDALVTALLDAARLVASQAKAAHAARKF